MPFTLEESNARLFEAQDEAVQTLRELCRPIPKEFASASAAPSLAPEAGEGVAFFATGEGSSASPFPTHDSGLRTQDSGLRTQDSALRRPRRSRLPCRSLLSSPIRRLGRDPRVSRPCFLAKDRQFLYVQSPCTVSRSPKWAIY
jgi:hypothetical protein